MHRKVFIVYCLASIKNKNTNTTEKLSRQRFSTHVILFRHQDYKMMPTNASCRLPGGPGTHMQSDHVGMWGICSSCSMWEQGTHCMHCTMIRGIQVRFLTSHEISQILWDFLDLIGHFEWICVMGDNVFGIVDNQRNFENWVIFLNFVVIIVPADGPAS